MSKISEVMTSPVITLARDGLIMDAVRLMSEKSISCVVITDSRDKPIGIITERDMVRRVLNNRIDPEATKIDAVMTSPVKTMSADMKVIQAIEAMHKFRFRRLVIAGDDGKLVGVVTQSNLMMKVHATQIELEKMNENLRKSLSSIQKYSKVGSRDARVKDLKAKIKKLEKEMTEYRKDTNPVRRNPGKPGRKGPHPSGKSGRGAYGRPRKPKKRKGPGRPRKAA